MMRKVMMVTDQRNKSSTSYPTSRDRQRFTGSGSQQLFRGGDIVSRHLDCRFCDCGGGRFGGRWQCDLTVDQQGKQPFDVNRLDQQLAVVGLDDLRHQHRRALQGERRVDDLAGIELRHSMQLVHQETDGMLAFAHDHDLAAAADSRAGATHHLAEVEHPDELFALVVIALQTKYADLFRTCAHRGRQHRAVGHRFHHVRGGNREQVVVAEEGGVFATFGDGRSGLHQELAAVVLRTGALHRAEGFEHHGDDIFLVTVADLEFTIAAGNRAGHDGVFAVMHGHLRGAPAVGDVEQGRVDLEEVADGALGVGGRDDARIAVDIEGGHLLLAADAAAEHVGEFRRRVEHDADAADHDGFVVEIADGGVINVSVLAVVQGGRSKLAHVILLLRAQRQDVFEAVFIDAAAQHGRGVVAGAGDDAAIAVVDEDARIYGVKTVDVGQDIGHLVHRRLVLFGLRQRTAQFRRQRPPAAIVGAFIQVAVEQVDQQAGGEFGVAHTRYQHGLIEVVDRLCEQFVAAVSGLADLVEDGLELEHFAALAGSHDLAVPDDALDGLGGSHDVK